MSAREGTVMVITAIFAASGFWIYPKALARGRLWVGAFSLLWGIANVVLFVWTMDMWATEDIEIPEPVDDTVSSPE